MTGERFPVAEAFERPFRYWVRLTAGAPLLRNRDLALLPGDLLLFEADRAAWVGRLTDYLGQGQVCGVRLTEDGNVRYDMALLTMGTHGPVYKLSDSPAPKEPRTTFLKRVQYQIVFDTRDIPELPPRSEKAASTSEAHVADEDDEVASASKAGVAVENVVAIRVCTVRP